MEPVLITPNFLGQLTASPRAFEHKMELTLNEQGIICGCDISADSSGYLFGYHQNTPAGGHISKLIPELASIKLMHDDRINPRLRFLSHIGHRFQLSSPSGQTFDVKFFIRVIKNKNRPYLKAMIFPFETELNPAKINEQQT
jgi:hypothetical protein